MKGLCIIVVVFIVLLNNTFAQNTDKLYNPKSNAAIDIANAAEQAKQENKHVFIQIGGNWCKWCLLFNDFVQSNDTVHKTLNNNYVIVHLNYSKENKNLDMLAEMDYPQRFGFPVFVILDTTGSRIHTQNSAYLEEGVGYSTKKVVQFLRHWSPKALNPENY